ncbi:MAG: peptidoglycan-binding protein [Candidatus Paceibacterota bacterium]|jgi:photosystem II stability/assembly factor-like uncharacterized protein
MKKSISFLFFVVLLLGMVIAGGVKQGKVFGYGIIQIISPSQGSAISSWQPNISWGIGNDTCEYSFDFGSTWHAVSCAGNGSDIPAPASGNNELDVRGCDIGGCTMRSVTFQLIPAVSITYPVSNAVIAPSDWQTPQFVTTNADACYYMWNPLVATDLGSRNWKSITSNSDGTKLAAVAFNNYIYTSTDSGATWKRRTGAGSRSWQSITSSSDGTKLAVVGSGYIYTSSDSGTTWAQRPNSGSRNWYSITSSSDGTKLVAGVNGGYIYTSTDSGVTWTERQGPGVRGWSSITSSSDGTKLVAGVNGGYIYTSTDSGVTWTQQTALGYNSWSSITSSSNGTKLAAASFGYIYTSSDSGTTWTQRPNAGSRNWQSITSSSDGTKLAVVVGAGSSDYIYTSVDSGITWGQQTAGGSHYWDSITSSADGSKLVAVAGSSSAGDYIYTSIDSGTTFVLRLAPQYDSNALVKLSSCSSASEILNPPHLNTNNKLTIIAANSSSVQSSSVTFQYMPPVPVVSITYPVEGAIHTPSDWHSPEFISTNTTACYYSWSPIQSMQRFWYAADISADGTKLVVSDYEHVFTSVNSGATWISQTGQGGQDWGWESVAMSDDGQRIVGADWIAYATMYISADGGVTWTKAIVNDPPSNKIFAYVTTSSDGMRMAATTNNGYIYTSVDGGLVWNKQNGSGSKYWNQISSSANGMTLVAVVGGGSEYVYISADGGVTWTPQLSLGQKRWEGAAMSDDGQKIIVGAEEGYLYVSTNGGTTWNNKTDDVNGAWFGVAVSGDGIKMAVIADNIYVSSDSGNTWSKRTGINGNFTSIKLSSDGSKLIVADNSPSPTIGGYVYISSDMGLTWEKTASVTSSTKLSSCSNNSEISLPPQDGANTLFIAGENDFNVLATSTTFIYGTPPSISISLPRTGNTVNQSQWNQLSYTHTNADACYYSWESDFYNEFKNVESNDWFAMASTQDASRIIAFEQGFNGGSAYLSTDKGATWDVIPNTGPIDWWAASFFNNDTQVIASGNFDYLYISNDAGATWGPVESLGVKNWYAVAGAASTTKVVAVDGGGYIYMSNDAGVTWNPMTDAGIDDWESIAISADGMKILAGTYNGRVVTSANGGVTWVTQAGISGGDLYTASMSADGGVMAIGDYNYNGSLYISTDGGITWTSTLTTSGGVQSVSVSADGTKVIAADYYGPVSISANGGVTWAIQEFLNAQGLSTIDSVTYSSDGSMYIVSGGGSLYVYTSSDYKKPLTPCGSTPAISTPAVGENTLYITGENIIGSTAASTTFTYDPSSVSEPDSTLSVVTAAASSVSQTSIILNGIITSATSTSHGFYYGTTSSYTSVSTTTGELGIGSFSESLTSLTCNTTYHYQAFAYDGTALAIGNDVIVTTSACTPTEGGSGAVVRNPSSDNQYDIEFLKKKIAELQAQLNALLGQNNHSSNLLPFLRPLKQGMKGTDVASLQKLLTSEGFTVETTGFFGPVTKSAITKFQEKYMSDILTPSGLKKGTGYFGKATMNKANQVCGMKMGVCR